MKTYVSCLGVNGTVNNFAPFVAGQQMCVLSLRTPDDVTGNGWVCRRYGLMRRVCMHFLASSGASMTPIRTRLKGPTYESGTRLQAASGLHHLMSNHFIILVCYPPCARPNRMADRYKG